MFVQWTRCNAVVVLKETVQCRNLICSYYWFRVCIQVCISFGQSSSPQELHHSHVQTRFQCGTALECALAVQNMTLGRAIEQGVPAISVAAHVFQTPQR